MIKKILFAAALFLSAAALSKAGEPEFTIHLMGDSTMADKDLSLGSPERGWGMVFENFVDDEVRVINYAKNGRSTESAIREGIWDNVKKAMKPGDFLFVQFGHNDEKVHKEGTGVPAWGKYQDNLRLFISTAREMGVTPVLLTPVARRKFVDGKLDPTTHGEYPAAMKEVARQTGTILIDMEDATIKWISEAGDEASKQYFMHLKKGEYAVRPDGLQDDTHSNARGARRNCEIVCDSISLKIPRITEHLVRYNFVVDPNGRGDFLKVQDAINACPDYLVSIPTTILVKPGIYKEKIHIPVSKRNIAIIGKDAESTVITYDDYAQKQYPDREEKMGTFGSSTMYIDGSYLSFCNITVENAAGPGEKVGQAVALTTTGDRIYFYNCRFLGYQDTIFTSGLYSADGQAPRTYYRDCYIEGTTDFIFGSGIAYFENCQIHSKKNSYITAASTDKGQKYGYVFNNCRFTAAEGVDKVYLGRPWRDYANVVYLNCELGSHIRPEGWHNWNKPQREKTAFYAEYNNRGPGSDTSKRVKWSKQLKAKQAAEYSFEKVIGRSDTWDPFANWQY